MEIIVVAFIAGLFVGAFAYSVGIKKKETPEERYAKEHEDFMHSRGVNGTCRYDKERDVYVIEGDPINIL